MTQYLSTSLGVDTRESTQGDNHSTRAHGKTPPVRRSGGYDHSNVSRLSGTADKREETGPSPPIIRQPSSTELVCAPTTLFYYYRSATMPRLPKGIKWVIHGLLQLLQRVTLWQPDIDMTAGTTAISWLWLQTPGAR
ncbi:hypothetical protein ACOMHN_050412 [Nucella lapillus]